MPDDADQLVEAVAARVVSLLAAMLTEQSNEFRRHHETHTRNYERLTRIVTGGVDRITALEKRVGEVEAHTEMIEAVAKLAYKRGEDRAVPPVPQELIDACRKPAGTLNTVVLDVLGREVHRTVTGGRDPDEVWRDLYLSVRDHMGSTDDAVPPSHRAPRRSARPRG